ncbi:MAG: DUF1934 domain-containing protein [Bacillota bacterium]|nr:DUF1934 domain-containing protein [Bacillota bacterium]
MKKDVIISIKGAFTEDGGEADGVELVTSGRYYEKNGKKYIVYEESEVTGFGEGTQTMLKIDGGTVTMSRSGVGATQMVFENGKRHMGYYETPYGTFTVSTITDRVKVHLGERSGNISIDYCIDVNNVPHSSNSLSMSIREA